VHWHNVDIRRYQGRLYAMSQLKPAPEAKISWDILGQAEIPLNGGTLSRSPSASGGLDGEQLRGAQVEVGFRQGGERARPAGDRHTRQLKKLFQEAHVPGWVRDRIPLIYVDGKLAAVPGLWVFEPFACAKPGKGLYLHWHAMSD
jgi:tRNA(Ile)-lysidine synthase